MPHKTVFISDADLSGTINKSFIFENRSFSFKNKSFILKTKTFIPRI